MLHPKYVNDLITTGLCMQQRIGPAFSKLAVDMSIVGIRRRFAFAIPVMWRKLVTKIMNICSSYLFWIVWNTFPLYG
jgi:hypothetical protein